MINLFIIDWHTWANLNNGSTTFLSKKDKRTCIIHTKSARSWDVFCLPIHYRCDELFDVLCSRGEEWDISPPLNFVCMFTNSSKKNTKSNIPNIGSRTLTVHKVNKQKLNRTFYINQKLFIFPVIVVVVYGDIKWLRHPSRVFEGIRVCLEENNPFYKHPL